MGQEKREIQIDLDKNKLASFGLSIPEVISSLQSQNREVPGGSLTGEERKMTLRTSGELGSVEDFYQLPISRRAGVQLYVKDIAAVVDGTKDLESLALFQGKPAIGISIVKQSGKNTVVVADAIKKVVAEIDWTAAVSLTCARKREWDINICAALSEIITLYNSPSLSIQHLLDGGLHHI